MSDDKDRAAFKEWAEENHLSTVRDIPTGFYCPDTAWCYDAWQAARTYYAPYKEAVDFMYESIGRNYGSMEPVEAAKAWMKSVLDDRESLSRSASKVGEVALQNEIEKIFQEMWGMVDAGYGYKCDVAAKTLLSLLKERGIV